MRANFKTNKYRGLGVRKGAESVPFRQMTANWFVYAHDMLIGAQLRAGT
jgi:hypothetical protein